MKRLLLAGVVAPLAFMGVVYAATVPSDYAQDVTAGQNQLATDQTAKIQADAITAGENVQGQVDEAQVQVDETISDQESEMGDNQTAEVTHGDATSGLSDSTTDSSSSDTGNSTGSTTTNGGATQ